MKFYSIDVITHSPVKEYPIISCELTHRLKGFAQAKVTVGSQLDFNKSTYYNIIDDNTTIFCGRVTEAIGDLNYVLEAVPMDIEEQKVKLHSRYSLEPEISALNPAELIIWNSTTLRGYYVFDPKVVKIVKPNLVYSHSIIRSGNCQNMVDLYVKWSNYFSETIDIGSDIFKLGGISTLTQDALTSAWPRQGTMYGNYHVVDSNIQEIKSHWEKVGQKYVKSTTLSGALLLRQECRVDYIENWKISLCSDEAGPKESMKLYLDLSKYFGFYPRWTAGIKYRKGSRIMFDYETYSRVKTCNCDHVAYDLELQRGYWEDESELYWHCNDNVLFKSKLGQEIFSRAAMHIYTHFLLEKPATILKASGPWEIWKSLEVGDLIRYEGITLVVVKYCKVYSSSKRFVSFECHANASSEHCGFQCDYWDKRTMHGLQIISEPRCTSSQDWDFSYEVLIHNDASEQKSQARIEPTYISFITSEDSMIINNCVELECCFKGVGNDIE